MKRDVFVMFNGGGGTCLNAPGWFSKGCKSNKTCCNSDIYSHNYNEVCKKKKIYSAFTLAEMMVVMLILSIVMAAFAPVMTTRSKSDRNSPWRYASDNSNIYYGLGENQTAMIGQPSKNLNLDPSSRLIITTSDSEQKHIVFKRGQDNLLGSLYMSSNSIVLGNGSTQGSSNVGIGIGSLKSATSNSNVAVGINTLSKTTGSSNTAVGDGALQNNTSGSLNTAMGTALANNTSGSRNTALGDDSMSTNTTGSNNTSVGYNALNTSNASDNTSVGHESLKNATTSYNTALGAKANSTLSNQGSYTTAIGYNAQATGTYSTAIGYNTQASGSSSTAIGYNSKVTSSSSIAAGNSSKAEGNWATAYGYGAKALKSETVAIGDVAEASEYAAIAMGYNAKADGANSVSIGYNSKATNTDAVAIGARGVTASGESSIAIGSQADQSTTTASGSGSVAIGDGALATGDWSVAIGTLAYSKGENNVAIGVNACQNVTGSNKTCIGPGSGPDSDDNIAVNSERWVYLGDRNSTVRIPGNLIVEGNVWIKGATYMNLRDGGHKKNFLSYEVGRHTNNDHPYLEAGNKNNWGHFEAGTKPGSDRPYSDRRLKYVGSEVTTGLDRIKQLKVFNFTFKKDEKKTPHVGVIAQDLQKVFPDAVTKDDNGFLTIRMEDMFYALINAVKELDAKVTMLIKQENSKDKKIKELEARLKKLEQQIK